MDTTSEFAALTPDYGLHETLISAEAQALYDQLAAAELRAPYATFSDSRREFEDNPLSELNDGPEDNWRDAHLFGFVPATEPSDDEIFDNSSKNCLELDDSICAVPVSPTLSFSNEINALFEDFNADAANSFYVNTIWDSDDWLSDGSTQTSQELEDSIFSTATSPASSTSDEEIDMLNDSFSTDSAKPSHVDGVPTMNTGSINNQDFPEQSPRLLHRRPKNASRARKRRARARAKGQKYLPKMRSQSRTTEWANVWVHVEKAGVECETGGFTEYRATRNGWRELSRAGATESTSTRVNAQVYCSLEDDLEEWNPEFIRYLDVRLNGDGFVVRILHDKSRGMFSGFDEMNEKHLRVGYSQVKVLLEKPEESVFLGRKWRKQS